MNHVAFTASLLALAVALAAAPASAQTAADAPVASQTADRPASDDDIVVTATRRSERLQDIPLSVTAFSQEELTQKGIVGFEGIARENLSASIHDSSREHAMLLIELFLLLGSEAVEVAHALHDEEHVSLGHGASRSVVITALRRTGG